MKIVESGGKYTVHSDDMCVYDQIPAGTFKLRKGQNGFYLIRTRDLVGGDERYGDVDRRTDMMVSSFIDSGRRMGVILMGEVGLGKSMMARVISERLRFEGIPTIIVDSVYDGMFGWLSDVDQTCMVLFDEFEKMLQYIDDEPAMLGYFDGTSTAMHLDVITVNDMHESFARFFENRPGRFRWYIRMDYPTSDDVLDYMYDHDFPVMDVEAVMRILPHVRLNYDMLHEISNEVSRGMHVADFIDDFNLIPPQKVSMQVDVEYEKDGVRKSCSKWVSKYPSQGFDFRLYDCGDMIDVEIEDAAPLNGSPIDLSLIGGDFGHKGVAKTLSHEYRLISVKASQSVNRHLFSGIIGGSPNQETVKTSLN